MEGIDEEKMVTDIKKVASVPSQKKNPFVTLIQYFGATKREFKTLSWTTKEELKKSTKLILISTFVSGFLVYFVDIVIQKALLSINLLTRLVFG